MGMASARPIGEKFFSIEHRSARARNKARQEQTPAGWCGMIVEQRSSMQVQEYLLVQYIPYNATNQAWTVAVGDAQISHQKEDRGGCGKGWALEDCRRGCRQRVTSLGS